LLVDGSFVELELALGPYGICSEIVADGFLALSAAMLSSW
jgi:hypothetical protein